MSSQDVELVPPSLPLFATIGRRGDGRIWLKKLPALVRQLQEHWSLRLGTPFHGGSCAWVAPVRLPDGGPAVLKVTWPHREAAGEADALELWDGNAAVRLYRRDRERHALLLERLDPGTELRSADGIPAEQRLVLAAAVLWELWSAPVPGRTTLERVGDVAAEWADGVEERMRRLRPGFDPGLVAHGARLLRELPTTSRREVVLHGDFNPGNVLAARRRPWLAIHAKPMIGDPAYDPWPLIGQVDDPFAHPEPHRVLAERGTVLADVLGEDADRLFAWSVARYVESALWEASRGDIGTGAAAMGRARVMADLIGL
jgi:streptomycin 6-kinase